MLLMEQIRLKMETPCLPPLVVCAPLSLHSQPGPTEARPTRQRG